MFQDVLQKNRFFIKDEIVLGIIKNLNVEYIRFLFDHDVDGKVILVANIPDNKVDVSLGKAWIKVNIRKNVFIIPTAYLKQYEGKTVQYRFEESFRGEFELFRIRPVDFEFIIPDRFERKRISRSINPNFSKSGCFVIPKLFASEKLDHNISIGRVSFNRTMSENIDKGIIFADIIMPPKFDKFSFLLNKDQYDFRTRRVISFKKLVESAGKELTDFKFASMVDDKGFKTMIFVEENNA